MNYKKYKRKFSEEERWKGKENFQKKKRRKKMERKEKPKIFKTNGRFHEFFYLVTQAVNFLVFCYIYKN